MVGKSPSAVAPGKILAVKPGGSSKSGLAESGLPKSVSGTLPQVEAQGVRGHVVSGRPDHLAGRLLL